MAENSNISWTDHTHNPWWGCTKISPGCTHCYADVQSTRHGFDIWGPKADRRFLSDDNWKKPLKWNRDAEAAGKRARVFCASMADVFEHHMIPNINSQMNLERARLWDLIERTPHLDWLLLTKRPENIRDMIPVRWLHDVPTNVWYGTSAENQQEADRRIPHLLKVPAVVRFISAEPLIAPLDLGRWLCCPWCGEGQQAIQDRNGTWYHKQPFGDFRCPTTSRGPAVHNIDWVIAGGESQHGARPMHPQWARDLRDQCLAAGVAYHFKQWGEWRPFNHNVSDMRYKKLWLHLDGEVITPIGGGCKRDAETVALMVRSGKKEAGDELDGRTWHDFPLPRIVVPS